jgi:electron transfer flavoprotein beta subunit
MIQRIAALVSIGLHPNSGAARHCRNDSLAMKIGLNLAESESAQMQVLHAGDAQNPALHDYLALGAPQIEVIETESNIVENLAANLKNADLILTGSRAESGDGSGLLPYLLAAKLNLPLIANALEIKPVADGVEILQFLPKGKRRLVSVQLPAVIVVHPLADVDLHYAFAQKIAGKIVALPAIKPENTGKIAAQTKRVNRKPIKLKAPEHKSGHERLLAAISSENKGGAVVNEGNSVEKAQVILDYLREHRLVDF